ncbi:hypothetical protein LCGC14_2342880 [marine sediment metagenome]|uniref:DUF1858 domain-containing protein n=1 Tax=marine sediment metagenome TaxID=412755 RepID=A0A0F9CCA7_9ZZZZ
MNKTRTSKAPKYILKNLGMTTQRQFKELKRYQLKVIIEAVAEYHLGCAYCPGSISVLIGAIETMKDELSVEKWGR